MRAVSAQVPRVSGNASGTRESGFFGSVAKAVFHAAPETGIVVLPGVYRESVVIGRNDLPRFYENAYRNRDASFGSGRLVRNLVENGVKRAEMRRAELSHGERAGDNRFFVDYALFCRDFRIYRRF